MARCCAGRLRPRGRGGIVSVPGSYVGFIHGFLFGDAVVKGLQFRKGQTHVRRHLPQLLEHIGNGKLQPQVIVSHHMKLDDAARGDEMFDKKLEDCREVTLTP